MLFIFGYYQSRDSLWRWPLKWPKLCRV